MAEKMAGGKSQLGLLFEQAAKNCGSYILWAVIVLYLINLIVLLTVALRHFADMFTLFGSFWLGALLGLLLGFYVQDSKAWNHRAMGAAAWVLAGSIVFLILRYQGDMREIWFYPMGLVGGFIIGTIWDTAKAAD